MPFLGLLLTSTLFWIPTRAAWRRRRGGLAAATGVLAATSCLYHGTEADLMRRLDHAYAHTYGIGMMVRVVRGVCTDPGLPSLGAAVLGSASGFMYYCRSARTRGWASRLWHMGVHVTAVGSLLCHIRSLPPSPVLRLLHPRRRLRG